MKTTPFILSLLLSASLSKAQNVPQVSYFPLQDVKLLDSPFLQAQQTDLHYILALNPDRLLAPFLREAGLTPKAPSYTNWENTGLDGHIGGHYLSALSMTSYTVPNKLSEQVLSEELRAVSNFGKKLKQVISVPEVSTSMANGCLSTIYTRHTPDYGTPTSIQAATRHAGC